MYQYSGFYPQYTSDGYTHNYDESYQNAEGLATYDGSTNQHYPYGIPVDQTTYYAQQPQDGNGAFNKKNIGLFDNPSEYTAHWVTSTTQIPANLKVSPDQPTDGTTNSAPEFTNWEESRSEYNAANNANAQQQSQQEALDQQLAQMNLGYGNQQYRTYGYPVNQQTGQAWQQGSFPPQDNRVDQNTQNKAPEFYNASNTGAPEFGNNSSAVKAGAPGQASWAEMVKKNGVSSGDIKIIRQPPPQPNPPPQNIQTGRRNQGNQRNFNQKYDKNSNGPKNYKQNDVIPNQQGNQPVYSTPPQLDNKTNHQQRNGNVQKPKVQNARSNANVGYAGFGNGPRPGTSALPLANFPVPTEFNPYVPPPPLLHFNPRVQNPGQGIQQPQGAPMFAGNPGYVMYPGQQQMGYFNPQFVVRPDQMMPPMYNMNDPYYPMNFRPPFEFDPRFGPMMYGMPRYRYPRNGRQNGKGGKMHNKNNRPGSKEENSVAPNIEKDKEEQKEEKLDETLAESVNRGPEFDLDEKPTPEPKGDN